MADINLSFRHGRTLEEARVRLADAATEVKKRLGALVRQAEWSPDRNAVHLSGDGFEVDAWVDAQETHLVGNLPLLGRLLGGPLALGLKQLLEHAFQKRLT